MERETKSNISVQGVQSIKERSRRYETVGWPRVVWRGGERGEGTCSLISLTTFSSASNVFTFPLFSPPRTSVSARSAKNEHGVQGRSVPRIIKESRQLTTGPLRARSVNRGRALARGLNLQRWRKTTKDTMPVRPFRLSGLNLPLSAPKRTD